MIQFGGIQGGGSGNGGSSSSLFGSESFETDGIVSAFSLSSASRIPKQVFRNGVEERPGIDYTVALNVVTFTDVPEASSDGTANLVIYYITVVSPLIVDPADIVDLIEADTSVGPIVLDMDSKKQRMFYSSDIIAANAVVTIANGANKITLKWNFELSAPVVLTMAGFVMADPRLIAGLLTLPDAGKYQLSAVWNSTEWFIENFNGPY